MRVKREIAEQNYPQAAPGPLAEKLLRSLRNGEPGPGKTMLTIEVPVEAIFLPEPHLRIFLMAQAAQQTGLPFLAPDAVHLPPMALKSHWIARHVQVRAGGKVVCHPFDPYVTTPEAIVGARPQDAVELARGLFRAYWSVRPFPDERVVIPPAPGWEENRPCFALIRRERQRARHLAELRRKANESSDGGEA